jgi:hypothetical protein
MLTRFIIVLVVLILALWVVVKFWNTPVQPEPTSEPTPFVTTMPTPWPAPSGVKG